MEYTTPSGRPLVWRAWLYPTDRDARAAYVLMYDALIADEHHGPETGLWRSKKSDLTEHYIILLTTPGNEHYGDDRALNGMPWEVPEPLRNMLYKRHLRVLLDRMAETGKVAVSATHQHGSGKFLHSDGTMHPFPEPRGRG